MAASSSTMAMRRGMRNYGVKTKRPGPWRARPREGSCWKLVDQLARRADHRHVDEPGAGVLGGREVDHVAAHVPVLEHLEAPERAGTGGVLAPPHRLDEDLGADVTLEVEGRGHALHLAVLLEVVAEFLDDRHHAVRRAGKHLRDRDAAGELVACDLRGQPEIGV